MGAKNIVNNIVPLFVVDVKCRTSLFVAPRSYTLKMGTGKRAGDELKKRWV